MQYVAKHINVIFKEIDVHLNFYSPGGSWCQNLRVLYRVIGKHVSNWRRHVITLTFDLWGHRVCHSDVGHCSPSVCKVWSSQAFPFRRYDWFSVIGLIGLVTLTINPLISKWDHRSPVARGSFLSISSSLHLSILELGSGTGQTDGQTYNSHHCIMSHPIGAEYNKSQTLRSLTQTFTSALKDNRSLLHFKTIKKITWLIKQLTCNALNFSLTSQLFRNNPRSGWVLQRRTFGNCGSGILYKPNAFPGIHLKASIEASKVKQYMFSHSTCCSSYIM